MATIEQQLELEQNMIDSGATAYLKAQRAAEADGKGHQLDYAQAIMKDFMLPLTDKLIEYLDKKGPGSKSRARVLLRQVSPDKAMFLAMRALFGSFTRDSAVAEIANNIGRMVEDELRFTLFQIEHGSYYDTIKQDFKRKGTSDYRFMHRVLTKKANDKGQDWSGWSNKERVEVGMVLLDVILSNTDLAYLDKRRGGKGWISEIKPSAESLEWIEQHEAVRQFMYPERHPCIIPPDPWTDIKQGGYYSPVLRSNVNMIKIRNGYKEIKDADLSRVRASINAVQAVPWAVNRRVLDVVKQVWHNSLQIGMPSKDKLEPTPCPVDGIKPEDMTEEQQAIFQDWKHEASAVYTAEKERVSRAFQISRIIRMANDYAQYENFWYVWYADFRGRLYTATAGFSPQGPDLAKGVLRFGNGKPLGVKGLYWLMVHGANRYGFDKASYNDRVEWVKERHDAFIRAARDPLSFRDTWANADKPYQFLAFLFEYEEAHQLADPTKYVSHLPIGLDGSCNGLQNFSAMLRDPVGGAATNLVPNDAPADIYSRVAEVCVRKIKEVLADAAGQADREEDYNFAYKWLQFGVDRKLAKRPVMTLPYGATRQSCTQYIFQSIVEKDKELFGSGWNFKAACWLTPLLWASIGEVVIAAREAMDWLQKVATVMSRVDAPIKWTTADGFLAYQKVRSIKSVQIETQLCGRFQVRVGDYTDIIDKPRQRLAISPNFVHSNDATHLRMTVNYLVDNGITDMSLIHDDYGVHAADTDKLHEAIRDCFVQLYKNNDPLASLKEDLEDQYGVSLPPLPLKGKLDIEKVRESLYFFG